MASAFLGLQTLRSLMDDTEPAIDWIVDGMIARGGQSFFVARPGAGKTLLLYYIAACVLTRSPVFGTIAVQQGAVIFIDLDMHRRGIARMRAVAALRGHGLTDEEIAGVPLYIAAHLSSVDLRLDDVRAKVISEIGAVSDLALVVLDTWSDLHHGKEGSPDDMTDTASGALAIATACNCGVAINHHQRKNGGDELEDVRGASSITAKADAVFLLKTERDDGGNPGALTFLQRKARLTEEARPRKIEFVATGDIDGNLQSYSYALTDATARLGRPPSTSNEATQIATRLLWQTPELPKADLVKRLIEAGIAKSTAYRVADVTLSQKSDDPGVIPILGKGGSPAVQGKPAFSLVPVGTSGNVGNENPETDDEPKADAPDDVPDAWMDAIWPKAGADD